MRLRAVAKSAHNTVAAALLAPVLRHEWRRAQESVLNERPVEYRYALEQLAARRARSVVDVGSGITAWPALLANCGYRTSAIDEARSYWGDGAGSFFNRHFLVQRDDITDPSLEPGTVDAVTCLSVLEHIPNHRAAMRGMFTLLRRGGHVILTGPWNESTFIDDAYRLPDAGYGREADQICRVYAKPQLDQWVDDNGAELVDQEWYRVFSGPLWTQGERIGPPVRVARDELHHLTCLTLRKP